MQNQDNISDREKFIRELREQVAARQRENKINEQALLESTTPDMIKSALEKISMVENDAAVAKVISIIADSDYDASLRILAMEKVSATASENSEFIQLLIRILGDANEDTAVRRAAFTLLAVFSFSAAELRPLNADLKATLRTLVDDSDKELRERAVETLAKRKDELFSKK